MIRRVRRGAFSRAALLLAARRLRRKAYQRRHHLHHRPRAVLAPSLVQRSALPAPSCWPWRLVHYHHAVYTRSGNEIEDSLASCSTRLYESRHLLRLPRHAAGHSLASCTVGWRACMMPPYAHLGCLRSLLILPVSGCPPRQRGSNPMWPLHTPVRPALSAPRLIHRNDGTFALASTLRCPGWTRLRSGIFLSVSAIFSLPPLVTKSHLHVFEPSLHTHSLHAAAAIVGNTQLPTSSRIDICGAFGCIFPFMVLCHARDNLSRLGLSVSRCAPSLVNRLSALLPNSAFLPCHYRDSLISHTVPGSVMSI